MPVSVVLVSHNGARWLPAVVAAVGEQTARIDHCVAIDTDSRDESVHILRESGSWDVQRLTGTPSFAESVALGLERLPVGPEGEPDWVWLLHDDSAPDPHALERLLDAAGRHRDVAILGPKLREWPSLRRLVELGVTISGTGRRETGLERGEYDQGQHDQERVVLAVNTAGMLVRREVLDQLGFDPRMPIYGNDIDFGWRAARAGWSSLVVPDAVVFHAEAAHRGLRRGRLVSHHARSARAAALRTLLANGSGAGLVPRALRLLLLGLVRSVGFLLVRAPRQAWGELAALVDVLGHPGRLAAARRDRARTAQLSPREVRHLLAPPWLPVRHLLDSVGDFGSALVDVGRESVGGRTVRSAHSVEVDDEESSLEPGLATLVLANPTFWFVIGTVVLALVGCREILTGGALHGGALAAAPDSVGHWWSAWWDRDHLLGSGSSAAAPGYLLPLTVLATVLLGHPGWAVTLVVVLGLPLAALGALRFLRRVCRGSAAPYGGALGYALLPVLIGALGQGRIGTLGAAIVLPWVATSALGLGSAEPDRRWRAAWRTGLGLALLTAFAPATWLVALVVAVGVVATGLVRDRVAWRQGSRWGVLATALVVPVPLLLPWLVQAVRSPGALAVEAGRPGALFAPPGLADLAVGHGGGPGSGPVWVGVALVVAGLLATLREDTRPVAVRCWTLAAATAAVLALVTHLRIVLPGVDDAFRPYAGALLLVLDAALLTAAAAAADGLRERLSARRLGVRHVVAAAGMAAGLVAVVGGAVWFVVSGTGGPLERGPVGGVPRYMSDLSAVDPANGVLVLRGDRSVGVRYTLLRDGPLPLGDDTIAALTPPDDRLTGLVTRLLTDPQEADAKALGRFGVAYVYAPAPTADRVASAFDAGDGFSRASAGTTQDSSWRLQESASLTSIRHGAGPWHRILALIQAVAVLAAIVLATPTRRRRFS